MNIHALVINHADQRYDTVGDWTTPGPNTLLVHVSKCNDPRYEALIMVHEIVEAVLCSYRGITAAEVDKFDLNYPSAAEPGDDPAAPYHKEHVVATEIERRLADELGVDWATYERYLEELTQ